MWFVKPILYIDCNIDMTIQTGRLQNTCAVYLASDRAWTQGRMSRDHAIAIPVGRSWKQRNDRFPHICDTLAIRSGISFLFSFSFSTCMHSCPSVFPCVVFLGVGHILDWYSQMFNSQHKVWSFAAFYCGQELSTCTGNDYLIDMLLWKRGDHNSIFFLNKYWFIHRQKTKWQ